jgi:hypothetical protein
MWSNAAPEVPAFIDGTVNRDRKMEQYFIVH